MNALDFRKRAIMSVINNVKGFERSVSGTSVTLEGCVDDDSIIDYKIYGNCYQDGEPSIENPIEVQCVGDRTKNLFDISSTRGFQSIYGALTNTVKNDELIVSTTAAARSCRMELGIFKAGTYTISFKCVNLNCGWGIETGDDLSSLTDIGLFPSATKQNLTFTLSETNKIWLKLHSIINTIPSYTFSNIQLEEGSEVTDYEPYGKYKIPITASGKNLFDKNDYVLEGNYLAFSCKHLKLGKTYTIVTNKQINLFKISDYFTSGTNVLRWNFTTVSFNLTEAVDNLPNKYMYIRFNSADGVINDIAQLDGAQLMIVEGSYTSETIGDYEPYYEPITTNIYLDEQLRGIDSYLDCVGYKDEFLERNIAKRFILSSDVGNKSATSTNTWYSYFVQMPSNVVFSVRVLSNIGGNSYNMYMSHRANGDDGGFYANINSSYFLAFRDLTTKEEIQSYLDNTEVYAYYVIQPIEIPITLPKLPTFKGTTIYKVGTSLQPANIEIKYYSNIKGE